MKEKHIPGFIAKKDQDIVPSTPPSAPPGPPPDFKSVSKKLTKDIRMATGLSNSLLSEIRGGRKLRARPEIKKKSAPSISKLLKSRRMQLIPEGDSSDDSSDWD